MKNLQTLLINITLLIIANTASAQMAQVQNVAAFNKVANNVLVITTNQDATAILWQTAIEANSSMFQVEASVNGSQFSTVKTVQASRNSSNKRNYQVQVPNSNAVKASVAYRVKVTFVDGSTLTTPAQLF